MSDWRDSALCFGLSPEEIDEIFFIKKGQKSKTAKRLCANCPIQDACLEFALIYEEQGIWAGTTDLEREHMSGLAFRLRTQAIAEGTYHPRPSWNDLFRPQSNQTIQHNPRQEGPVPVRLSAPIEEVLGRVDELLLTLLAG